MGADLYIRRIHDKAAEEYRPKFYLACNIRDTLPRNSKEHALMQSVVEEYDEKMHPEDGYFRDSYNDSSVLWQMGLSWWEDVIPLCDNPPDELKDEKREAWWKENPDNLDPQKLLDLIRPKLKSFRDRMRKMAGTVEKPRGAWDTAPKTYVYTQEDVDYYLDKAAQLVRFLETAIENGDRIYASL